MKYRKFIWIGKNKFRNKLIVSEIMDTEVILKQQFVSFWAASNRLDNCEMYAELFHNDIIQLQLKEESLFLTIDLSGDYPIVIGEQMNGQNLEDIIQRPDFVNFEIQY